MGAKQIPQWILDLVVELPELITANELLPVLRCKRRTLTRLIQEKRFRPIQHEQVRGSRLLFPKAQVVEYLRHLDAVA